MPMAQKVIGVCGLMGSGKSVVMRYFAHLGYPVYDCDAAAKEMYYASEVRKQITELMGMDPIDVGGQLKKTELSNALSSSPATKLQLEKIIHSALLKDFERWCASFPETEIVFMESAILFTSGFDKHCDMIIAVDAPEEARRERIIRRDGDKDSERFERVKGLQIREAELIKRADIHIMNNNKCSIIRQLEEVNSKLLDLSTKA